MLEDYFSINGGKISKDELRHKFNIKGEEQTTIFNCALNELVTEGCLFFDGKNYRLFTNEIGLAYGEIEVNKNGCAFVHTKDNYTILIENIDLNGALDGDTVLVNEISNKRKDFYSGKIYKILKRKNGFAIFEVNGNALSAELIPYNGFNNINISLNKNELRNLVDGELIKVIIGTKYNIVSYEEKDENDNIKKYNKIIFDAQLDSVIGHKTDPDIDIKLLANKYCIPIEFSKEAMKEANSLPLEVTEQDIIGRVDLRDKNIITIDCDDTKDRDDAVYVEMLSNGNYRLIVSIASVNHYVKRGMKLYDEAKIRCTSHYPKNTCIPMFPHIISNGICSLNPNVDRLTKTCDMEIDKDGKIINIEVYNSVINSKMAMKYSEVNDVLEGKHIDNYTPFIEQLKLMKELSDILEKNKKKRCSLNFEIADVKIIQDKQNKPIGFKKTGVGIAENMIENFMLEANSCVAEYFSWMPIIYRVHSTPDLDKVRNAIKILNSSNINIPKIKNIDEHSIRKILDSIKSSTEGEIIKSILLKSMKNAKYSTLNSGHFALQLNNYCHFTSPIRRISDFITHTIIDDILELNIDYDKIEKEAVDVSKDASFAEKVDEDMESEAKLMSMAEYMEGHIGEEFDAYVTDISKNGMFVITKESIPGKVKITDIFDDTYHFDKNKNILIGRNDGKYRIGNEVTVTVKSASKENRTINFEIPKQKKLKI